MVRISGERRAYLSIASIGKISGRSWASAWLPVRVLWPFFLVVLAWSEIEKARTNPGKILLFILSIFYLLPKINKKPRKNKLYLLERGL
jgi:hypothetical protein